MDRHTIIFSTDERQRNLGELLPGTQTFCSWEDYEKEESKEDKIEKIYVLPTPVSKLDSLTDVAEKLKRKLQKEIASGKTLLVFGGAFTESWRSFFVWHNISYVDFMKQESITEGNAYITAEATIAELLKLSPYSIRAQNVIVTGYGKCAKAIAQLLKRLEASVTVVARREEAKNAAKEEGYEVCDFSEIKDKVQMCHSVINTVPALVLTQEILSAMPQDAVILDIASKPGGTDFDAAKELGIRSKLALGLPGIYSTKSSALLLEKAMLQYAPLQAQERGEQSWIFQIII